MQKYLAIAAVAALTGCGKSDAGAAALSQSAAAAGASVTQPLTLKKPLPSDAIVLRRAVIPDPGVVGRGPAMYVMLPESWTGRGGVELSQQACNEPFGVNWSASSPDGASSVAIFPAEIWQWSTYDMQSQCPRSDHKNIRDYLAARAAHDAALAEAQRQSRYLATWLPPTVPERADHPQRALNLAMLAGLLVGVWSILVLAAYAIRDRR